MREEVAAKARRLLGEGRITLRVLSDDAIVAEVRGDSARRYRAGWNAGGWWCECPHGIVQRPARCSHVRGLQLVVLEPVGMEGVNA